MRDLLHLDAAACLLGALLLLVLPRQWLLAALTAAIHANGILGSEQPKQETAEDILASIINPPAKDVK